MNQQNANAIKRELVAGLSRIQKDSGQTDRAFSVSLGQAESTWGCVRYRVNKGRYEIGRQFILAAVKEYPEFLDLCMPLLYGEEDMAVIGRFATIP